jgi:CheY-like chemotaxis protein
MTDISFDQKFEPCDVLVVEDELSLAETISQFLIRGGLRVRTAHGAASALRSASIAPPRVAIIDYQIPGMNGLDLAAKLRGELPTLQIIWRHVLRFIWRDVNVRATADIGYALMAVTALSFLGLGAQSPTPEWGLLIRSSSDYFYVAWWYMAFPGLAVTLTAVSFSVLADWIAARKRH